MNGMLPSECSGMGADNNSRECRTHSWNESGLNRFAIKSVVPW